MSPETPATPRPLLNTAFLAVLFLSGLLHWTLFFGLDGRTFKPPSFKAGDWPKEYRYYSVLQQAVRAPRIPYYISRPIPFTKRFLAIPEVSWSPQVLLLRFLSVEAFIVGNVLLLYSAGFLACLLIRRRYGLSLLPFALLFLLFNFNGHVTAHLAVGHSMWAGYFLLPFFFLWVLELLEPSPSDALPLKLAAVLFAILLQGAFHILVWCVLFLLLMAAFNWSSARAILVTLVWAVALSACRLVPAFFMVGRTDPSFISGFPSLPDLWQALTSIKDPTYERRGGAFGGLNWWEYDTFIGLPGLLWIGTFGIYLRFKRGHALRGLQYRGLDGPLCAVALFSLGSVYRVINLLPLPLLSSQRVASRFLILPVGFLMVISAIRMQALLERANPRGLRAALGVWALGTALLLGAHSFAWKLPTVENALPLRGRDLSIAIVAPGEAPDEAKRGAYLMSVKLSALVSLGTLLALGWRLGRSPRGGQAAISSA